MSKSVPDRWLQYKSYGEVIRGTKILAFKVPLREGVARNLQPNERFTTTILLQSFPNLKYIVDLTNTSRYYDKKDFIDAGVKYEKVMVPGIQVPPLDAVKKFFKAMDEFSAVCGDDEIIGVHCTHGVNRTGYFICRYLVQQLGWKLTHALKAFQEARGHEIERQNYVNELKKTPCGQKLDTSNVQLTSARGRPRRHSAKQRLPPNHPGGRPGGLPIPGGGPPIPPPYLMGPPGPGFPGPPRPNFANGGPFPPPRFNFPVPPQSGFGPRPRGPPPLLGPRFGHRPGPRMGIRPLMPPPVMGPQVPHPRGPPRMPIPLRLPGPPRLPMAPRPRLSPPKLPPLMRPLVPPSIPGKRNSVLNRRKTRSGMGFPKTVKDQDFTVDTFEENLTAPPIKSPKIDLSIS